MARLHLFPGHPAFTAVPGVGTVEQAAAALPVPTPAPTRTTRPAATGEAPLPPPGGATYAAPGGHVPAPHYPGALPVARALAMAQEAGRPPTLRQRLRRISLPEAGT